LCGITEAFPGPVSVDFGALGPGLTALVGQNGAGKSTLIGSIFAALFRQRPGQKRSLYDFCTHPKPDIDLAFSVNGQRYRSLLKIDPKSRQMESYLFNGEGARSPTKSCTAHWDTTAAAANAIQNSGMKPPT
jgi:DNA repair exonuclease SbcCD ATPase subunit